MLRNAGLVVPFKLEVGRVGHDRICFWCFIQDLEDVVIVLLSADTFRKYREKKLAEDPTWTLAKVMLYSIYSPEIVVRCILAGSRS